MMVMCWHKLSSISKLSTSPATAILIRYTNLFKVYVNTFMADELKDVNSQGGSIEGQKSVINRNDLTLLRTERKLSMYASVTKVIPNIHDPSKTSGYMVDRDKRVIEKFEFDADKMTPYQTCNSIWEVINKQ